jgi:hypothetical protein
MPDPPHIPSPSGFWAWLVGVIASLLLLLRSVRDVIGITGLGDWVKQAFWDKFFAKRAKEREAEAAKPARIGDVKILETTIATVNTNLSARMGELGAIVHATATDLNDATEELRGAMRLMDESNDQHLGALHDKVNETREAMSAVKQQVSDMPKVLIAELVLQGFLPPAKQPVPAPVKKDGP